MAIYTMEIATDITFPNITVYRQFCDGVHYGWKFVSNDGYVMYDETEWSVETNPDTFELTQVRNYFTNVYCPLNYNWDNFTWVAVLKSTVDEKLCF